MTALNPDLDCLFVHAPKADNHYLPFGDFFNITYMPMGMPAMAAVLRDHGYTTEVVHLGVEWLVDPEFSVVSAFEGADIRAIGLSLYWHYQSYDAIEVARALKRSHPDAFVFLGGITAGYFAEQIVAEFPFVDAVLKGHAETSCLILNETLKEGGDLGAVPSLVWRKGDEVVVNSTHATRTIDLDTVRFADLGALRNVDTYSRSFGFPLAYGREFSRVENRNMLSMGRAFFPLFIGRGCPWRCTFCGGNRDTLRRVNGTNRLVWRSQQSVLADIERAMDHGYKTMALCFDPTPTRDEYYVTLFEEIARRKLGVDFYFECWGLPTERFVKAFRRAFPSEESYIAVSPDAGNEQVRRLNKQPFYTDAQLFQALDWFDEYELSFDVFYTIALPGEVLETARDTQRQINAIAAKYTRARRLMTWSVQLEPGSPQFERPEDFSMITDRSRFRDFYNAHGGDRADTYSSLGYKIEGYFGDHRDEGGIEEFEKHLQHLKCMEFCFLGRDPRFWKSPAEGRQHCFERRRMLAERRGSPVPERPIADTWYYGDAVAEERAGRPSRERYSWI